MKKWMISLGVGAAVLLAGAGLAFAWTDSYSQPDHTVPAITSPFVQPQHTPAIQDAPAQPQVTPATHVAPAQPQVTPTTQVAPAQPQVTPTTQPPSDHPQHYHQAGDYWDGCDHPDRNDSGWHDDGHQEGDSHRDG